MTLGPRTEREKIIAEAAHLQGYADGVKAVTELLREQRLRALVAIQNTQEPSTIEVK